MEDKIKSYKDWNTSKVVDEEAMDPANGDAYARDKGLNLKTVSGSTQSELTSGGNIESTLIDVVAELKRLSGLSLTITAGNDKFHKGHPNSLHNKGLALDVVSPSFSNESIRLKFEGFIINLMKSGKYDINGMRLGGINEYDNPSSYSTGGHFHISLYTNTPNKDGKECNFTLSGVTTYKQIRDLKAGKPLTPVTGRMKTKPVKRQKKKKYFKLVYGKEKKVITLKPITNTKFNVYSRYKTFIGTIEKVGDKIILYKQGGEEINLSEFKLGQKVESIIQELNQSSGYVDKTKNKPEPAKSFKDSFEISGDSDIAHTYSGEQAKNIKIIEDVAKSRGITNPKSIIGMLTVIGKESNFVPRSENMNYSKERLPEMWGYFSKTGEPVKSGQGKYNYNSKAVSYANNPKKLANLVYGKKPYGIRDDAYGNEDRGDGWKYRGRGFNQLTFKGSYEKYSDLIGIDLVADPDKLNDPKIAAEVMIAFFLDRFKQRGINPNTFNTVEDAIKTYASANAGWGNNSTAEVNKAMDISSNFKEA